MSEKDHYILPTKSSKKLVLGQLFGAANAIECAAIMERYSGPILLITTDTRSTMQLYDEILYFIRHPLLIFPDWETLPYDSFSPNQKIISDRLATLYRLPTFTNGVIILSVRTLMQRVCPYKFLHCYTLMISKGQHLPQNILFSHLEQIGYHRVDQVVERGEFSIHGALLDLYPMGSKESYRVEFFDDKIDNLRIFDVDTQCTLKEVISILLLPSHEFPTDKAAIELFQIQWRKYFEVPRDAEHIYQQVSKGILPAGIEYWQPLFFSEPLVSLLSYLPTNTLIINTDDIETSACYFWDNICTTFHNRCLNPMRPLLPPDTLWLQVDHLFDELTEWSTIELSTKTFPKKSGYYNMNYQPLPDLSVEINSKVPMDKLYRFYKQFNGAIIFFVENKGRWKILNEMLKQIEILPLLINQLEEVDKPRTYLIIGSAIKRGFIDIQRARALICEGDMLGKIVSYHRKNSYRTLNKDTFIQNFTELREGQPLVHLEYGIGRYAGMTTLETSGIKSEYLILTYADNDKLYVPISSLHLINRYVGNSDENAPLHKLGSDAWARSRQKAVKQIRDVAVELLDIYARRSAKNGFTFRCNRENYKLFCKGFPFELTLDQKKAIKAVLNDMCKPIAMDRLICGDVGFGKTEVAMRAAFLAIENHKQVAVLVPTTLLANQHFDNFRDRFANWPVRIEMISRFRKKEDHTQILKEIAEGKTDILIGTHKILQCNIQWSNLGLLIIDEEHHFGVLHKERIKAVYSNIDILTLTATPIPRTLNMAIEGIRDLSIIATPPSQRLAVKTFVHEYNTLIVREAILREILRGGQVYYLHNNVKNIEKTANRLKELVPEARIGISHGQLHERELEQVMNDLRHQRINVLVCTTIIETGIDIANVNTIIIERADNFGLSQLHQLRGRVGRSHHQAYAYLLTSPIKLLSQDARKRLEVIASLKDLGVGFMLATHDLEIRGAGELLGEEQSGQIKTIGFSLYRELLKNAVNAIKVGREPSLDDLTNQLTTEVELRIPSLLPEEYIPDVSTRLSLYKRIASAANDLEIKDLQIELIDRFGLLPDPARHLLAITSLKQRAKDLGIRRIESNSKSGFIEFSNTTCIDHSYLINLLKQEPGTYQLDGPTRLRFMCDLTDRTTRLQYVDELLRKFQQHTLSV